VPSTNENRLFRRLQEGRFCRLRPFGQPELPQRASGMIQALVTVAGANGGQVSIRDDVLSGIQKASAATGVDFSYLMAQANRESSFDPLAKAKTSSASGLYQFVEQTWLGVVKAHGAEYGKGDMADHIVRHSDGRFSVDSRALRKEILDLRRDPAFAAAMAAEHAADNKAKLEDKLGRKATGTDLYMAHFLGISGALKFLRTLAHSPETTGAKLFPRAAAANTGVFYAANGRARSVEEIHDIFAGKIEADMQAYAGLENRSSPGSAQQFAEIAPRLNGAGPNGTGLSGLGYPASSLSPLMLMTLVAPPVSRDEKDEKNGGRPRDFAELGNQLGQSLSPLRLDLMQALPEAFSA
jgi:Transglycosylase SLT domain